MTEWLTVAQLSDLLNKPCNTVRKSVQRGRYSIIKQSDTSARSRGGKIWLINIHDPAIPGNIRQKYLSSFTTKNDYTQDRQETAIKPVSPVPSSFPKERAESMLPVPASNLMVSDKFKDIALARFDLVKAWQEHRQRFASQKECLRTDQDFERAYNMSLLAPRIFQILGSVDICSIKRWHRTLSGSQDWTLLVPGWNCQKREPALTAEEKKVFLDCLLNPNRLSIGEATKITMVVLNKKNISSQSAPITYRRWAEWFKNKNSHIWTFLRDGQKALNDREIFSIKRDHSKLQVGDVVVADGHRLNFEVINPYTGKPCRATIIGYQDWKSWDLAGFEIMLQENVQTISSAMRNAIIRLGEKPKVAYQDNGKAFKAKFFTESIDFEEAGFYGLFGKLGITPVFTMKYNAKAKPIERFWKEFTGKFERLLPSFTGASVEDKPAWMHMGETFHKIHHNGYIPTITETIEMVNTWIREYLEIQDCPHVKGKTIGEVFRDGQGTGVDIDELDELMMATEIKTIRANGIRFLGADYYSDVLFGLREKVFIRYSLSDLSSIKVYDMNGRFLAVAQRTMAVHPMAAQLGTAKDVSEVKHLQNKQRALQKNVVKAARELISQNKALPPWSDIIPMTPDTIEKIEQTAALSPESEEIHIPACMLKKNSGPSDISSNKSEAVSSDISGQSERPTVFRNNFSKLTWLMEHGCETEEDREFLEIMKKDNFYRMMYMTDEEQDATKDQYVKPIKPHNPLSAGSWG